MFDYPLATTLIPPGIRKLLANLSGRIDFSPTIETEHFPALVKVVLQSNAIGVGTEEAFVEDIAKGSLVLLHWRNLPQNLESMNARCGIVSRTGFRLSPAARAMIETLVAVDRAGSQRRCLRTSSRAGPLPQWSSIRERIPTVGAGLLAKRPSNTAIQSLAAANSGATHSLTLNGLRISLCCAARSTLSCKLPRNAGSSVDGNTSLNF